MAFSQIDILWILLCAVLVFTMQAGFLCLESGLSRSKNSINVALKNVADFAIAVSLFWAFGFALMFGASFGGWVGSSDFLVPVGHGADPGYAAFFLFQAMFCATAATIVSGAVAERMRFSAYLVIAALVGGLIYPVFGHWAWGGALNDGSGWLADRGFVDFAGSTVVHSVGGWVALAAIIVVGPRLGRFSGTDQSGSVQVFTAGNLPLAMLGTLFLILGWFGFNGGSTFALDATVPAILANTALASVAGILGAMALSWFIRGYAEVIYALNGAIAGLVAITAVANAVSALEAVLIGLVGGFIMVVSHDFLVRRRIDDAVGAVSAHLAAGVWGTLAVALFADLEQLGTGLSRLEQLQVQALGVLVCAVWAFGLAYLFLRALDPWFPLRVTPEQEHIGLNVSEHGACSDLNDLLRTMERQENTQDLRIRAPVDPFTEVGQIALRYNRVMDTLSRAVAQTQAIIRHVNEGIVTASRDGVIRSLNPGAEKLFGVKSVDVIGQAVTVLWAGAGSETIAEVKNQDWVPGNRLEFRLRRPETGMRHIEISLSETQMENERLVTGLIRDVTERWQFLDKLQKQRDLARITLASIGDGVITTDETGVVRYINPVAEKLTGWTLSEAKGLVITQIYRLQDEATREWIQNPVLSVLRHNREMRRHDHAMLVKRSGVGVPVHDTAAPIRDRHGNLMGVILVFNDVTITLNLTRELTHQAAHDALTGIPNRREFERRLGQLLQAPRSADSVHVLCYLDLDQFKIVNDTCGHVAGDELLRQVTTLLRERLRASDWIARLGGDEFGILFHSCPVYKAVEMADTLRLVIQDFRFVWTGQTFAIGVSIGLVPITAEDHDLDKLLANADTACYAAKESGRNRVHLYQRDDHEVQRQFGQMQWVTRLQAALDQDRLRLFAQPIVPIRAFGIEGYTLPLGSVPARKRHYEILVRIEEDGRLISPGAFIPAAERYGLMTQVDFWVFSNTLAWLSDWLRQSKNNASLFSVNVSGISLSDARFRQDLTDHIAQAKLPAGSLCIEITESSAMANLSKVLEFIKDVKNLGCSFALDDFGSGLSSFAYLKTLPVDYLKIDGGFIKDIMDDATDFAMVQAINTIGHTMGLKTIAEFVESDAIYKKLAEIGIDYAQGYFTGEPRPLTELHQVKMMPR